MLFFADVSMFARLPFKTRSGYLSDIDIRDFEGSEYVFSVPGSKISAENLKTNLGNPPKVSRKAP